MTDCGHSVSDVGQGHARVDGKRALFDNGPGLSIPKGVVGAPGSCADVPLLTVNRHIGNWTAATLGHEPQNSHQSLCGFSKLLANASDRSFRVSPGESTMSSRTVVVLTVENISKSYGTCSTAPRRASPQRWKVVDRLHFESWGNKRWSTRLLLPSATSRAIDTFM
jgi:hypothetical protein